jgi:hypothetical protein
MKRIIQLFWVFLLISNGDFAINKIVYLISPPRSLSVAFMRMMQARGDFAVFHEPSQKSYDLIHDQEFAQQSFVDNAPSTFSEVKQQIFETAAHRNVFVKEMSFAVRDFLIADKEIMQNPNVRFIFLVRNPHHSIISFYKKCASIPKNFSFLCGYQATYELFKAAQERGVRKPLIIYSEDLYENSENTAKLICNHLEIPFLPQSLSWQDLSSEFEGHQEWHETKFKEVTQHWHGEAIRSSGWGKPSSYHVDEHSQPTFEEITDSEHRLACQKAYEENKLYYDLMKHATT